MKTSVFTAQAKIVATPKQQRLLWQHHLLFNQKVAEGASIILKLVKQPEPTDYGCFCQRYLRALINAPDGYQNFYTAMGGLWKTEAAAKRAAKRAAFEANKTVVTAVGEGLAKEAESWLAKGYVAFDGAAFASSNGVPLIDSFISDIWNAIFANLRSYKELIRLHKQNKAEWKERLNAYLSDPENAKYLAVKPKIDRFFIARTKRNQARTSRWVEFIDYLSSPEFQTWENPNDSFVPLSTGQCEQLAKVKPNRYASAYIKAVLTNNPHLERLKKKDFEFRKTFLLGKRKDQQPSFTRKPAFCPCNPNGFGKGTQYRVFPAPQSANTSGLEGYHNLRLKPSGSSIRIRHNPQLLLGRNNKRKLYMTLPIKASPKLLRLSLAIPKGATPREQAQAVRKSNSVYQGWTYNDAWLNCKMKAEVSGARLIADKESLVFDKNNNFVRGAFYLSFTIEVENQPLSKIASEIKTKADADDAAHAIPNGAKLLGLDATFTNTSAFAAIAKRENDKTVIEKLFPIKVFHSKNFNGCNRNVTRHKRHLFKMRQASSGSMYPKQLSKHLNNRRKEFIRRCIASIAYEAVKHRVDAVVVEQLSFSPDGRNPKSINRSYADFSWEQRKELLYAYAKRYGFKVLIRRSRGTSQVCHVCQSIGLRFQEWKENGEVKMREQQVGKRFYCPKCDSIRDADLNAAANVAKMAHRKDKHLDSFYSLDSKQKAVARDLAFQKLKNRVYSGRQHCAV